MGTTLFLCDAALCACAGITFDTMKGLTYFSTQRDVVIPGSNVLISTNGSQLWHDFIPVGCKRPVRIRVFDTTSLVILSHEAAPQWAAAGLVDSNLRYFRLHFELHRTEIPQR